MPDKIKVLHVIKTFNLGGAETNLLNLAEVFDQENIENHVAYSYGGEIEQRFRDAGLKLFKYAEKSHRIKDPQSILIVLRLAAYIRRHRIQIVQTHNFNAHIWGLFAARLGGAKLIEHVHDFRYTPADLLAKRHGLLGQYKFIKYFKNWSDLVVVLTRDNAEYVIGEGFAPRRKVVEMQNGIPLQKSPEIATAPLRLRFGVPTDAVTVLTSARMDPTKNIVMVLKIAARLKRTAPTTVFLIAGSGDHLDEYKKLAATMGLEGQVRFLGFQSDMYSLLAASDIFLLPSFLELHSIAILEAMKMKKPVVVSDKVGCNSEFIQNKSNGYLCDPFLEEPWVEAVEQLALNPQLRAQVGARGYETCERLFDIRQTAARFERVYQSLVA